MKNSTTFYKKHFPGFDDKLFDSKPFYIPHKTLSGVQQ